MGEANVLDRFGVAGLIGYGRATAHNLSEPYDINAFRVGIQGAWYALGDFDNGMQLGVQGLHRRFSVSDEIDGVQISSLANAVDVSGFIGYKAILGPGITLLAQAGGGVQFIMAESEAEQGQNSASAEGQTTLPAILFNLNLGWSI